MLNEQNDIDPASLEIFKTVLESPSGKAWLTHYIVRVLSDSHIVIPSTEYGLKGYIYYIHSGGPEFNITIKQEDSWLKKWIKRQLM